MDRRKFLETMAVLGAGSVLLSASGPELSGKTPGWGRKSHAAGFDDNLICIISDLHVRPGKYQEQYFEKTVRDILALNPLPSRVICLGDIAYLTGKPEEYEAAKALLGRLEEAGMKLTLTMGNHDRRSRFAEVFPEHAAASLLPGRHVYKVETDKADFIVLDSLQEGEDSNKWITPGALDEDQLEWLKATLESRDGKPFFVMAHHNIKELKIGKLLMGCPSCCGYIHGHEHIWNPGWIHMNYKDRTMLRTLCVPSTGHWGDIGFVTLRLEDDGAVATLHESEFFFPRPAKEGEQKPRLWSAIENEHRGVECSFPY